MGKNYMHYDMLDEITYPFPSYTGAIFEVWEVIPSHTLLVMWLIIDAGIKFNPCL